MGFSLGGKPTGASTPQLGAPPTGGGFTLGGGPGVNSSAPLPGAKKSSGGLFGDITHAIGGAAHAVASKADLAAHDIEAMPAGIVKMGGDEYKALKSTVQHPWVTGKQKQALLHDWQHPMAPQQAAVDKPVAADVQGMVHGTVSSLKHPLRDPFQTALSLGLVAAPAAKAADMAGLIPAERALQVPAVVGEGEDLKVVHNPVHLQPAESPTARAAQAIHDKIVQRSLDKNVTAAKPSRLARYGASRVGKSVSESARIGQRVRTVPVEMLERSGKKFDSGVSRGLGQLAMFLRSANVTGDDAAKFWTKQAAAGEDTSKLARMAQAIHDKGLLQHDPETGTVAVNADRFPKLAAADELLKQNQATREGVIQEHGLMTPGGVATRRNLVAETMHSDAAVNPATGTREGQGYTPLRTSEKANPLQSPIARGRGPVIPQAKPFSVGKTATGEGVAKGLVPDNTTAGVARATREALRYVGTNEHRGMVARLGSDIKRTGDDVLVADPRAAKLGKLDQSDEQLLGRQKSTLGTISEAEHAGLAQAMRAKLEEHIPGLRDNFAAEKQAGVGTTAPLGYKWVPKQMLGDLTRAVAPRGWPGKVADEVNRAITAATVYFKLSHIPQRLTTNATTSAISGALKPSSIRAAITMRKALTDKEYAEAAAATGTHGYLAIPHEGTTKLAHLATGGAKFYAKRIDTPFRFLNLVDTAAKAGIRTPEQFRDLLAAAKDPAKATSRQLTVLKRSNRISMMYDGLGENEQRIISRGLWFYGWTKAAARYGGHVVAEHPLKAAALGRIGEVGKQVQASRLGPLPSYEYGLVPIGSDKTSNPGSLLPFTTAAQVAGLVARPGTAIQQANPVTAALATLLTSVDAYGDKTNSPGMAALSNLLAATPEAQIVGAYLHPSKPTQAFQNTPLSELAKALAGPTLPRKTNKAALNKDAAKEHERPITIYVP